MRFTAFHPSRTAVRTNRSAICLRPVAPKLVNCAGNDVCRGTATQSANVRGDVRGVDRRVVVRILSVGENVEHLQVEDRVLIPSTQHAWQERLVAPAKGLFPLPSDADPQQLRSCSANTSSSRRVIG